MAQAEYLKKGSLVFSQGVIIFVVSEHNEYPTFQTLTYFMKQQKLENKIIPDNIATKPNNKCYHNGKRTNG